MKPTKFDAKALQARLKELVEYDALTGVFTAKHSVGNVKAGSKRENKDAVGYLRFSVDRVQRLSHVLAWVYVYGEQPDGCIDHINGIKDDNRIANLRDTDASTNSHNKPMTSCAGVSKKRKLFRAKIGINGTVKHLGYFSTPEEAHSAYAKAKRSLFEGIEMRFNKVSK
jgi:hypothetical protein